jgi:hypothetical protein
MIMSMGERFHPSLVGIHEHLRRARLWLEEAEHARSSDEALHRLMAVVYPGRAVLELMRESAKRGELVVPAKELDRRLEHLVPRSRLVKALRIRDFHHWGIVGGGRMVVQFQVRLPPHGHAEFSMFVDPDNPRPSIAVSDGTRNYTFFLTSDRVIQDERETHALSYFRLLSEYLYDLKSAVAEYESLLRRPRIDLRSV